jgi:hypothetical protein
MVRADMRITLNVKGDRVVRAHVRARERCGNGVSGFLEFNLPPAEAIEIRNDRFHYGVTFDDARGNGTLVLEGLVHRRSINGVFLFRNHQDKSCGTGRPGYRRVLYTARLTSQPRALGGETPHLAGISKPGIGLEPTTPSLPWKCSTN